MRSVTPNADLDCRTGTRTGTRTSDAGRSAPEPRDAIAVLAPGEVIAERFEIVRLLGRGGMGQVYEARDLELEIRLAIKVIHPGRSRFRSALERFKDETLNARKVTHPNVCRIFDLLQHRGVDDGWGRSPRPLTFLTMELLAGESLRQTLRRRGPLPPEEVLELAKGMAAALDAAHQAGVAHRDFQAGNVQLVPDADGLRPVVTDFGVAHGTHQGGGSAKGQGWVGNPVTVAPEVVAGEEATAAVDVYAFGIVLFQMLTGTAPFVGETVDLTARKRLEEAPVKPSTLCPGLHPAWDRVILRCLSLRPEDRPAKATQAVRDLAHDLVDGLEGGSPQDREGSVEESQRGLDPQAAAARPMPGFRRLAPALTGVLAVAFAAALLPWLVQSSTSTEIQSRSSTSSTSVPIGSLSDLPGSDPPRPVIAIERLAFDGPRQEVDPTTIFAERMLAEIGAGGHFRPIFLSDTEDPSSLRSSTNPISSMASKPTYKSADYIVRGALALGAEGQPPELHLELIDAMSGETIHRIADQGTLMETSARAGAGLRKALGISTTHDELRSSRAGRPADPEAFRLYIQGRSLLRRLEHAQALESLQRAAELSPESAWVHAARAEALAGLGHDQAAMTAATRALGLADRLPREQRLLLEGLMLETQRKWHEATKIYEALWIFFPDDPDHGLRLAAVQTRGEDPRRALATLDELRQRGESRDPRIELAEAEAAAARSDLDRQARAAARAARLGGELGAPGVVTHARLLEALALDKSGRTEDAKRALYEVLATFKSQGDRRSEAEVIVHLAEARSPLFWETGLDLERATNVFRQVGDQLGTARALVQWGRVEPDATRSRDLLDEAWSIASTLGHFQTQAEILNARAIKAHLRGERLQTIDLFTRAASLARESGNLDLLAGILSNRAGEMIATHAYEDCIEEYQEVLELSRHRSRFVYVVTLAKVAQLLKNVGRAVDAKRRAEQALDIASQTRQPMPAGLACGSLLETAMLRGDAHQMESLLEGKCQWPLDDADHVLHRQGFEVLRSLSEGRLDQAVEHSARLRRDSEGLYLPWSRNLASEIELLRDRPTEALRLIEAWKQDRFEKSIDVYLQMLLIRAQLDAGRVERAHAGLEALSSRDLQGSLADMYTVTRLRSAAHSGDIEARRELVERLPSLAESGLTFLVHDVERTLARFAEDP